MARPGHDGHHQALVQTLVCGLEAGVTLSLWEQITVERVPIAEPVPMPAQPDVVLREVFPEPARVAAERRIDRCVSSVDGRRRTRIHRDSVYAALDEGVTTTVWWSGHEVLPLPTLEEQEAKLA